MKKFYLGALGCLLTMGASAQTVSPMNSIDNAYLMGSISKEFTNTSKGIVYTMEENGNAVEFKLYDEQFNVAKTLNMSTGTSYSRSVIERRESVVTTTDMDRSDVTSSYVDWYETYRHGSVVFDVDTITAYLKAQSFYEIKDIYTIGDSTIFVTLYYEESYNGKKYPRECYIFNDEKLYFQRTYYKSVYTGEWVTDINYFGASETPFFVNYVDFDQSTFMEDIESYTFGTQTLFNIDNKLEFLRRVYEEVPDERSLREMDRDYDGEKDFREMRYDNRTKAFEVVNEDNEVLEIIDCPADSKSSYLYIFHWGDNFYLGVMSAFESEDDYTYSLDIYLIEKETNSIRKINSAPLMRAIPALAERNSTVNVTLDAETAKNGGELIITDSNGRTVGRSHVEAGQTSVPVTTDRMGSGVYNITLTEKGQKVENARIIVK